MSALGPTWARASSASNETTVTAPRSSALPPGRPVTRIEEGMLSGRLVRSAPDALRYEPGVFVQQTAHSQGSAFVRGLTGQQTLLLFDGIRLNNSTYRQGPNQYFFTLDAGSIQSLEIQRGGGSTRFGSDALGGVIIAFPVEPEGSLNEAVRPSLTLRGATADAERGGRLALSGALGEVRYVLGAGARRTENLESAGPVRSPVNGSQPEVPRLATDGRTQLGTGFRELTADGRLAYSPSASAKLTVATYVYRQYDAPRTDQCPPPAARLDECLRYEEQFRTLAYGRLEVDAGQAGPLALTLSWQRQHERRVTDRPSAYVKLLGLDAVDTFGLIFRAPALVDSDGPPRLHVGAGLETYRDAVGSEAFLTFTDVERTLAQTRGQYLEGSTYLYGGAYGEVELGLTERLTGSAGLRLSWASARAPADPASGSPSISRDFFPLVGTVGLALRASPALTLLSTYDESFRAPNLDDLTSRQQTGPGFQLENPLLRPERARTLEAGARLSSAAVSAELWAFHTWLVDAVAKVPREASACPDQSPGCAASWTRFQLANARGVSELRGLEALARLRMPAGLAARVTAALALGEGPNPTEPSSHAGVTYEERVPLSRIPPINGTAELTWSHAIGVTVTAALRWALPQTRLAIADRSDPRIPFGGTPGFAVVDLRLSQRSRLGALHLAVENVFDAPYRYHGSSVNGPGLSLAAVLEVTPP